MPQVDGLELDLSELEEYPVAIAHGSLDPVIPVEFSRAAREAMTAAGADVLFHEAPLPHTIDPRILSQLEKLVARATGRK
jgi:phospholipase/carboxylesterase